MSNSNICELEDIAWEFADNDDHIVPRGGSKKSGYALESNISKRPRFEVRCAEINADSRGASVNAIGEEGASVVSVRKEEETMEKSPWSHSSSGGFSASPAGGSNEKTSYLTSDGEKTSNQCMISSNMDSVGSVADGPILGDQTGAVDNDFHPYQLNNASQAEDSFAFFDDDPEGKESNDLLYYGWPEIETFEDVDKIFRSCDTTYGLEIENPDELSWFSPPHATEGSGDALKSSFDFPDSVPCALNSVAEQQEADGLRNNGVLADQSEMKLTTISCKEDSHKLIPDGPSSVANPYDNGSGAVPHIDTQTQIHSHVSPSRHQKTSEGKRKERSLENGVSFIHFDGLNQAGESNHLLNSQCSFSAGSHPQQDINHQAFLQMPTPSIKPKKHHQTTQVLASPGISTIQSQDDGLPSISQREPSHASSQIQSVESSRDVSFQNPAGSGNKKRHRLHQRRLSRYSEKSSLVVQRADTDHDAKKQIHNIDNEGEGQSEGIGILGELDSSTVQESSCMSSVLDEVSVDASSLQQLQHVMEQLDIRTKLCIRDSLYRLARSAEQRHKCVNKSGMGDVKDTNGALLSDETNKCTGFMDMETDTNPIDRSIAHLLFHRPSDPSATPVAFNAEPVKYHTVVQAPNHGQLRAEKPVCPEETTSANDEVAEHTT